MNLEAIRELLKRKPFEPFEVRMSRGDVYQVRHPEQVLVLKTNVVIGFPETDKLAVCALLHIASLQTVQSQVS